MFEVWLRPNRRAILAGMLPPASLGLGALALALRFDSPWLVASMWGVAAVCGATLGALVAWCRVPRLAYRNGQLLVYLRGFQPERVPIEYVEVFFPGQAASRLPAPWFGQLGSSSRETATVVVRLAERAPEWHRRPAKAALGSWCDGYISICGTWCEPIQADLIRRLNQRLVEVQRERRAASPQQVEGGSGTAPESAKDAPA